MFIPPKQQQQQNNMFFNSFGYTHFLQAESRKDRT